jgi:tRNA threonylcarbamoyladenosine biosynthesis protein TsaB
MTTILAIETSTEQASVALWSEHGLQSRELEGVQTHSQGVLPMLQGLLRDAGLRLDQCSVLGFGCGPGAFTGVRTACGVVQGLAFGAGLQVVPVISLMAMAEAARQKCGLQEFVCVLDARMEEVYWAHYRYQPQSEAWQAVTEPALSAAKALPELADFSQAALAYGKGVLLDGLPAHVQKIACMPHAQEVAVLARQRWLAGQAVAPEHAQPLYLRNKVALTTQERQAVAEQKKAAP